ncbi:MAG: hypothetical protein ABI685_11185 [Ferruginibacter sp.]
MLINFTPVQRRRLLLFLQVGKINAINARRIAQHMGFPLGGNQVMTRNLIRECIEHERDLIASTLSNPKGFYKVDTINTVELHSYLDSLENRAREINERRTWMLNNWINGGHPLSNKRNLRLR